jgi:glutathione peroxidase-family protein
MDLARFLVDGDSRVVARFEPSVDPMSDEVVTAVERLLTRED